MEVTVSGKTVWLRDRIPAREGWPLRQLLARAATDPGKEGTLTVAPAGTATSKPKFECTAALVRNRRIDYPFDNGCRMRIQFQMNDAWTETSY